MTRSIFYLVLLCFITVSLSAQKNTLTSAMDSDPAAKVILDKLKQKYDGLAGMDVKFKLSILIPEQMEEVQEGRLSQSGDRYRAEIQSQTIVSDGKTLWIYLANNNEVQINDADMEDESGMLSPKDLLRIYEKGDYVYALVNQFAKDGKLIEQIEFKPIDPDSEYAKLRLSVDKKKNAVDTIEAFGKDGSRFVLTFLGIKENPQFQPGFFTFNPKDYPGVYVEDFRE